MRLVPCKFLLPEHHSRGHVKLMSRFLLLSNAEDYLGLGRLVTDEAGKGTHWALQSGDTLPLEAVTHWTWLSKPASLVGRDISDTDELFDEDGYPTAYAGRQLANWSHDDAMGWFAFAQRLWHFKDFFHIEEQADKWVLHISTAGWSGNEGLLTEMKRNAILWSSCWVSNRRGGHYVFEVEKDRDVPADEAAG